MRIPTLLPGLRAIAPQFDAFILDLWGVIHDGHSAFPHSRETLLRLKEAGCRILLLSNAPRRSYVLVEQMESFGIPRDLYDDVMSSGEATRQALLDRSDPYFAALGDTCWHMGPDRDVSVFEDLPVRRAERLEEASFIVNTGPSSFDQTVEDFMPDLEAARKLDLPMVCANPDLVVIRQGRRVLCAGGIAARYEEMGGKVGYRGKPDSAIYRLCVERLGVNPYRVAVVGDALETDMRGAANAGLTGVWVTGGIHAAELDAGYGKPAAPVRMAEVAKRHGLAPTAALSGFIW